MVMSQSQNNIHSPLHTEILMYGLLPLALMRSTMTFAYDLQYSGPQKMDKLSLCQLGLVSCWRALGD